LKKISNHSNPKNPDLGENLAIMAVTGFHQLIYPKIRSLAGEKVVIRIIFGTK
jgi:hypothetical protein